MAYLTKTRILILYCLAFMSLLGCGKGCGGTPHALEVALRDKGNVVNYDEIHKTLTVNEAKDLTPLLTCDPTTIEWLFIADPQFSDLSSLSRLIHLDRLYVHRTAVTDLSHLSKLTNLRDLSLSGTRVTDLSPLRSLSNLEELSLVRTKIDDLSPLTALTKLKRINLAESRIGGLLTLSKLKNLEWLNLVKGTATPKEVAMLKKALPRCEIFSD